MFTVSTCDRDIEVMLEDSTGAAVMDHQILKQFLQSMVDHMHIGAQGSQVVTILHLYNICQILVYCKGNLYKL